MTVIARPRRPAASRIPVVLGLFICLPLWAQEEPAATTQTVFIRAGEALLVREVGARWHSLAGMLEGAGVDNFLYSARALGPGDFNLSASLTIHGLARSAASVVINWDSHLGFEGAGGELFTSGPVFGNRFRALDPSA